MFQLRLFDDKQDEEEETIEIIANRCIDFKK